ncbi:MAG: NAD(P)H-hydrate dehydratase, partial [Burkholderiales bacterium]|nr:NAD(P)H-hydrate dehydratase [Burkholderiales bacterium]
GDVLTGVIAGLRAQGLISPVAARLGVWAHAAAGDDAASDGETGILASDLFPHIRRRLNRLVRHADC